MLVVRGARFTFWSTSTFAGEAICLCSRMCLIQFENKAGKNELICSENHYLYSAIMWLSSWLTCDSSLVPIPGQTAITWLLTPALFMPNEPHGWTDGLIACRASNTWVLTFNEGNATWFPVLWVIRTHVPKCVNIVKCGGHMRRRHGYTLEKDHQSIMGLQKWKTRSHNFRRFGFFPPPN